MKAGLASLGLMLAGTANPAWGHQLNVFATSDCETVTVEAKFASGKRPVAGQVTVKNAAEEIVLTLALDEDGTATFDLSAVDPDGGLLVAVAAGGHENYWILTPQDLEGACGS